MSWRRRAEWVSARLSPPDVSKKEPQAEWLTNSRHAFLTHPEVPGQGAGWPRAPHPPTPSCRLRLLLGPSPGGPPAGGLCTWSQVPRLGANEPPRAPPADTAALRVRVSAGNLHRDWQTRPKPGSARVQPTLRSPGRLLQDGGSTVLDLFTPQPRSEKWGLGHEGKEYIYFLTVLEARSPRSRCR